MKVQWDYSERAATYAKRPDYAQGAIDAIVAQAGVGPGDSACDVGAGSGHLTEPLLRRGLHVSAVEPNAPMAEVGKARTAAYDNVRWFTGQGEATGMADHAFDLVTFGSSFNVADRMLALKETARILKPGHWFACIWNHRDLDDPLQRRIEELIHAHVPGYQLGVRREDQAPVIRESGLFDEPVTLDFPVNHDTDRDEWCDAWLSHATLARQAGDKMARVVEDIRALVAGESGPVLSVPYRTRGWMAQLKA
ncbi:MAG TPA: methyltransferase domain-containing protein [Magnetospirillum sp.]|nr:methyltransferase domain-containing protein [Magnetospirillum sp.]